jgi:hypothetical protein
MRRILVGPLVTSAAIASIVIGSATVASAQHTVELGDTGTVIAKGAGAVVPVEVTCLPSEIPPFPFPPFPGSGVSVQLTQRSGNRIAQGFGSANVVCDGTPQTVYVQVTAQQAPFKNGQALATATMYHCDVSGCHPASDSEEIELRK